MSLSSIPSQLFQRRVETFSAAIRFAFVGPFLAVILMEGLDLILLSYILLIYITTMTTDIRNIQRAFFKYTICCETMTWLAPDPSLLQYCTEPPSPGSTRFHPHGQGDRLLSDISGRNSSRTIDTLTLNNNPHPPTLGLDGGLNGYCSRIENLHGPNLFDLNVSHPPVNTNFLTPEFPIPGLPVHNGAVPQHFFSTYQSASKATLSSSVPFQEEDSWTAPLEAEAYTNFINPQGMAQGSRFPTDAAPFSGLDPREASISNDLGSSTTNFNSENVHYAAPPHQHSFDTANLNSLRHPTMTVHSYGSNLRYPSPKNNFDHLEPSETSAASNVSTQHYPAPNIININGLGNAMTLTHSRTSIPHQCAPNVSSLGVRKRSGIPTSHNFVQRNLASKAGNFKSLETSGILTPSESSTAYPSAPDMRVYNKLGSSGISTPMQVAPEMRKSNKFKPSKGTPRHRPTSTVNNSSSVDHSDTSAPCHPLNSTANHQDLDPSGVAIASPIVTEIIDSNDPKIPATSPKDEVDHEADIDYCFTLFTTLNDDPGPTSDKCETGGLNAPNAHNVNNSHLPVALEPGTRQHSTEQSVRGASPEGMPPPRRMYRRRTESNVLPAGVEPCQKTKQMKDTRAKNGRNHRSSSDRRSNPRNRYFCIIPSCKSSREMRYEGFPTYDDIGRHLTAHEEPQYLCPLPHNAEHQNRFARRDGLRL